MSLPRMRWRYASFSSATLWSYAHPIPTNLSTRITHALFCDQISILESDITARNKDPEVTHIFNIIDYCYTVSWILSLV
jgi:hypothetical protein